MHAVQFLNGLSQVLQLGGGGGSLCQNHDRGIVS